MKRTLFLLAALMSMTAMCMATDVKEGVTTAINGVKTIKCNSKVTMHISRGQRATVRVVENGKLHSNVTFDGKKLTVDGPSGRNNGYNIDGSSIKTELFVTLPQMTDVSNSGILNLDAKGMTASSDVEISNNGQAEIDLGTFSSTSGAFTLKNHGVVTFSAELINSGDVNITNNGVVKMDKGVAIRAKNANISVPGVINVSGMKINADKCKLSCSGMVKGSAFAINSDETTLSVTGAYSADTDVKGNTLTMSVSGIASGKMNFNGSDMKLSCSGQTSSAIKVKCNNLSLSGTGIIKSAVTGSARSATISGNVSEKCIKDLSAGNVVNRSNSDYDNIFNRSNSVTRSNSDDRDVW